MTFNKQLPAKVINRVKRGYGNWKIRRAQRKFFPHLRANIKTRASKTFIGYTGYQSELQKLRDIHYGKRGFVIANGPSLNKIDIFKLRNEITIGCNGIFESYSDWGFHTTYYMIEDKAQTQLRAGKIARLKGPVKLAALHNAASFPIRNDMLLFNTALIQRRKDNDEFQVEFSKNFSSVAHLGSTVTYLMLQFSFHIGLETVYIVGLDHNYGALPKLFPPGKIKVTEENYHLVQQCHYDKSYYKIGDVIGVPHVKIQEEAYAKARHAYEQEGRRIVNVSPGSKLTVFETADFESIGF